MPNHVTTRCTVTGSADDIARFREHCIVRKTDDKGNAWTLLDFESVIPMPACCGEVVENGQSGDVLALLAGTSAMVQIWEDMRRFDHAGQLGPWKGLACFENGEIEQRLEQALPGCIAQARAMARCIGETGFKSWYDWSIASWGTKWNSYQFNIVADEPLEFTFQTAWAFPLPVFEKIAAEFPALRLHCLSFDEGWNFACAGYFNPAAGDKPFTTVEPNDAIYTQVYGHAPEREEDDVA